MVPAGASVRSEKIWIDQGYPLNNSVDHWLAFAILGKSGEWPTTQGPSSDESILFFQTHSQTLGLSYPDVAIAQKPCAGTNSTTCSYSWAATNNGAVEGEIFGVMGGLVGVTSWSKYIIHFRPGYLSAHSPRLEVWEALNGGAYVKRVDSTHINTYNTDVNGANGECSYPRIGFYHFDNEWDSNFATYAAYMTTLYHGIGASLYSQAEASLSGLT
jgi:hypothetical protein